MKETRSKISTAIYVRVSTEEQAQEGFSIRGQTEKLKAYALIKEWDIYDIYADEGISGKNIKDRPAINRLINDVKNNKVNNVLVFKVDRLTRSTKNLLELVELFEKTNCAFNSLTESIDTDTPSGRMFLKIIGIFAEFERENLTSRLKLGYERKVKEGYTLANYRISYGYVKPKGQKVQSIDKCEARIVKEIFSMFVDKNISMSSIARKLNERKIPTKMNATWETSTIKEILVNPTYIGKVRYSITDENKYFEIDGHHEPIISSEMFFLAGEKIKNFAITSKTKRPKEQSYFCGVLTCSLCNSKFTTHNYLIKSNGNEKKYRTSYRCYKKRSCYKNIACKCPDISHLKVESAFGDYINNINDITEKIEISIEKTAHNKEQELLKRIVDCEKNLKILHNRKKQVMEQYVKGKIDFDEYKNMKNMFNENFDILESELQQLKSKLATTTNTPEFLPEDLITNIKQNWEKLNDKERMIFLQRFIKRIIITVKRGSGNVNTVKIDNIEFQCMIYEKAG